MLKPFRFSVIDKAPNTPGVYVFFLRHRCIYVGKTEVSLRQRLTQHWVGSHNRKLRTYLDANGKELKICYKDINQSGMIDVWERYCIKTYQPVANDIMYRSATVNTPLECQ